MTRQDAIARAQRNAKHWQQDRFVVWSVEDSDAPGEHYHTASATVLDTFFLGCSVVVAVGPDGEVQS